MNKDAAWYYPEPKEAAKSIKGHVAFWRGAKVTEQTDEKPRGSKDGDIQLARL